MTKNLKWRLGKLPTPDEVSALVKGDLLTKDEAREILFKVEDDNTREVDSFKEEIKFLRGLVEKLSNGQTNTIHTYITEKSYPQWNWYQPYASWCSTTSFTNSNSIMNGASGTNAVSLVNYSGAEGNNLLYASGSSASSFTDIQTF